MKPKDVPIILCVFAILAASGGFAQDYWIGPSAGYWSNAANWSTGLPGPSDDVVIQNGGNYYMIYVHLDTSSSINSLALGGALIGPHYSVLADSPLAPQLISIATTTKIGQSGIWTVFGTANVGSLDNSGDVQVGHNGTLSLLNQPNGITDVGQYAIFDVEGNFNAGGRSAFANLTTIESGGDVALANGQTTNILPIGGVLTSSGELSSFQGSTVQVNGDLFGDGLAFVVGQNSILNVTGSLVNAFSIGLFPGSVAHVGALNNIYGGDWQDHINASGFGAMMVNGAVTLGQGQSLDIDLDNGFVPVLGSTYKFVTFAPGELSGEFGSIFNIYIDQTEEWKVIYDNADGYIELSQERRSPPAFC